MIKGPKLRLKALAPLMVHKTLRELKRPGGEVIDPREEKIPYRLFLILTAWCPKRLFFQKILNLNVNSQSFGDVTQYTYLHN